MFFCYIFHIPNIEIACLLLMYIVTVLLDRVVDHLSNAAYATHNSNVINVPLMLRINIRRGHYMATMK